MITNLSIFSFFLISTVLAVPLNNTGRHQRRSTVNKPKVRREDFSEQQNQQIDDAIEDVMRLAVGGCFTDDCPIMGRYFPLDDEQIGDVNRASGLIPT